MEKELKQYYRERFSRKKIRKLEKRYLELCTRAREGALEDDEVYNSELHPLAIDFILSRNSWARSDNEYRIEVKGKKIRLDSTKVPDFFKQDFLDAGILENEVYEIIDIKKFDELKTPIPFNNDRVNIFQYTLENNIGFGAYKILVKGIERCVSNYFFQIQEDF